MFKNKVIIISNSKQFNYILDGINNNGYYFL